MNSSLMKKASRLVAWTMTASTALWMAIPSAAAATPTYTFKWIGQTPDTITADGVAHYVSVNPGDSVTLSVTVQNLTGGTIKGKSSLPAAPAGYQVPIGSYGIGVRGDAQTPWLDASSFVLNGNRLAYYDGPDVAQGSNITISFTVKVASSAANGVYNLYYKPVRDYLAWTRQVAWNGKVLDKDKSDIFTRFYVGTTPTVSGSVNVGVSASTPPASNVSVLATDVVMTQLTFTAAASDNAMVNSIVVRRSGLSADDDVSDIKLYDGATKLGSTQGLNTTTHKATFTGLSWLIPAGTSKTLTIKATIPSTGDQGKIIQLGIESAADVVLSSGTATVGGTFPAYGNNFTIAAVSVGYLAVTAPTTPASANVISGSTDQDLASFKFATSSTEGFDVNSIKLTEVGTSVDSDVTNLKLKINGVQIGTTMSGLSNGTVTFTGSPLFSVPAGQNKTVYVVGDIADGITSQRTVQFQVEDATHVVAVGQNSHGAVTITSDTSGTAFSTLSAAGTFTIVQGTLTVAFDATNLAAQAYIIGDTQIEVSKFKFSTGSREGVKVTKLKFEENGAATSTDYQNVRLYIGDSTTPIATSGSVSGTTTTFEDGNGLFEVPKSGNTVVTLKLDISSSAAATDTLQFGLGNASTDYSYVTAYGLDSNEKIPQDSSHITLTTCADTNASVHTIAANGTLVVSAGPNTPAAANVSRGVVGWEFMQFRMQAISEAARVTATTVRFYDDASSSDAYTSGDEAATGDVTNAKLYYLNGATWTQLGSDVSTPSSGVATFAFDITIPKNTTTTFKVTADIPTSSTAPTSYLYTDIAGTGSNSLNIYDEVTATGVSSGASYGSGDTSGSADGNVFTKVAPTLTVTASTTPAGHSVVLNGTNVLLGKFFLTANDVEDIRVSTIKLYFDQDAGNMASASNADTDLANVHLMVDGNSNLTSISKPVTNAAIDYVTFTGSDLGVHQSDWIAPKGGSIIVGVYGDIVGTDSTTLCVGMTASTSNIVAAGASSGASATISGLSGIWESPELTLASAGTLTVASATDTPNVQQVTMSYTGQTFTPAFYRVKLTAANEDIKVSALRAKIADSGDATEDDAFLGTVYAYEGGTIVNNVLTGGTLVGSGSLIPVSGEPSAADVVFTTPVTVPTGGSKYLTLTADINTSTGGADSGDVPYLGLDYNITSGYWAGFTASRTNIKAVGVSSNQNIYYNGGAVLKGNAVNVVRARLGLTMNSSSPSGTATRQANHTIFKMNATNTSSDVDARVRAALDEDTDSNATWVNEGTLASVNTDTTKYVVGSGAVNFTKVDFTGDSTEGISKDGGAASFATSYTRVSFWVRSTAAIAAGDLTFVMATNAALTAGTVTVSVPAVAINQWGRVDSAITPATTQYFGLVVSHASNQDNKTIQLDGVTFYNDSIKMNLAGSGSGTLFATTANTNLPVYLKDANTNATLATGYVNGTGTAKLSTANAEVTWIPTAEIAIPASGRTFNVVADTTQLVTAASTNLSMSINLGSASSAGAITAGDVLWNDNSRSTAIGWVDVPGGDNPLSRGLNF